MYKTPTKNADTSFTQSLTPVRFLDSPKLSSTRTAADSNFAVAKTRLEVIVKTLQDNYAKWQLAQKRGLALCSTIETVKVRCLEPAPKANQDATSEKRDVNDDTLYPEELRSYCDKLSIIASICVDITSNARESLRQLRALSKLPGSCNEIFFRSWQLPDFVAFVEQLLAAYERESQVKLEVMRELPHCLSRAELIRCTCAWEYPQYVDIAWVSLMFVFLAEEINLSRK